MLDRLKKLFGGAASVDLKEKVKSGALIIDVRTLGEYNSGHVKGSVNIPLDQLQGKISKLDKDKTIITCCASGMRSASAKGMLLSKGFTEVHNGGGWSSLEHKIS